MAAPRPQPNGNDCVPLTPGGIALAHQRAERGERTVVVDNDGTPLFAVVPAHDMDRLRSDDLKRRLAWERIEQISALFPEDNAAELAMETALEYRNEMRRAMATPKPRPDGEDAAVVRMNDLDGLRADDERSRAAVARIYEIAENFPEDEPEDAAMAAALEYRRQMRDEMDREARRREAAARLLEIGKFFTDPDAGERAMEAAMEVRAEMRAEADSGRR